MQRFKEIAALAAVFFFGWQIGLFACTAVNPEQQGYCQRPKCQDYAKVCPSGWAVGPEGRWHRCCRTYTGSHTNPPCCEWSRRSYSYIDPGCRSFQCVTGSPPNQTRVTHCERKYATPYGNWEQGEEYICEALGDYQGCGEKAGYCSRL